MDNPEQPGTAPADDKWEFDLNGIKNRERKAFNADFTNAQLQDDDSIMYPWLAKVVRKMPFEGEPSKPETFGELGMAQFREVMTQFLASFRAFFVTAEAPVPQRDAGGEGRAAGDS
jgi:hypothetical protein